MVSLNQGGQGRVAHSSQDAIASILASMNNQVRYYLFLLLLKELRLDEIGREEKKRCCKTLGSNLYVKIRKDLCYCSEANIFTTLSA